MSVAIRSLLVSLCLVAAIGCDGSQRVILEPIADSFEHHDPPRDSGTRDASDVMEVDAASDASTDAAIGNDDDAGAESPDPGLDPNVHFDWIETLPGQGTCGPGHYVGSFSCSTGAPGAPPPLAGQLHFDLAGSAEGELSIQNGVVSDLATVFFRGDIMGTLNCVTGKLDAISSNGMSVAIGGVLAPFRTFRARLEGDFDKESLELHGDFLMTNDAGEVCTGTFQAGVAP